MKQRILKILCAVSGVSALVCLVRLILAVVLLWEELEKAMTGIIGGADAPTVAFWFHYFLFKAPVFWCLLGSIAVFIVTLILLRKKK